DSAWMRYKYRYGKDFTEVTRENDKSVPKFQKKKITATESSKYNTISWGVVAVAAALVCLIVIYGYPSQKASVSDVSPMKEIVTKHGQRIHFRVSGGAKVMLNAGSKLIAPKDLVDSTRTVQLAGQAVCDVAAGSAR